MKMRINVDNGKNIFFISDFHFYHKNILKFDNRPFETIDEMHTEIIKNWNNVVKHNDTVFYLGDLCFGDVTKARNLVNQLMGEIHFVMGNHDEYHDIKEIGRFSTINDLVDLKINGNKYNGTSFVLCHYPIFSFNKMHHGNIMIHGHSHMGLSKGSFHQTTRIFDVGCNGWDYTPVHYETIIKMAEKIDYKKSNNHHLDK